MKKLSYLLSLCLTLAFASTQAQQCDADFRYSINGLTVDFTDSSLTPRGGFPTFSWDFDDGPGSTSTSQNPTYTFSSGGSYVVCLTVSDTLCFDTKCDTVTVTAPASSICNASWSYSVDTINTGTVYFNNTSSPLVGSSFNWNFGDGTATTAASTSTMTSPTHTFAVSGTYWVNLTMIDSIGDTCVFMDSVVISVPMASCNASFSIEKDSSTQYNIILYNNSTNASSHSYSWDFGDGTTDTGRTPLHTYQSFGSYEVCLTITDSILGCDTTVYCDTVGMDSLGNLKAGFGIEVRDGLTVGIDDEQDEFSGFNLFPNPAKNNINVDLRGRNDLVNIRIMDLSGRMVTERLNTLSGKLETFEISNYSKGIYFMILDNGNTQTVEKFIVAN